MYGGDVDKMPAADFCPTVVEVSQLLTEYLRSARGLRK